MCMKKYLDVKFFVGLFIVILLILYTYPQLIENVQKMNLLYFLISFFVFLIIVGVKQLKWYLLVNNNWRFAFKTYFPGQFINEIAPIGSGDIAKAYLIKKYSKKSFGSSLVAPYMERMIDVTILSLLTIFASIFLFLSLISSYISLLFTIIIILALGFLLTALFPVKMANIIKKIMQISRKVIRVKYLDKIIKKIEIFVVNVSEEFQKAVMTFANKRTLMVFLFFMALCDWFLEGVCLLFMLKALGFSIPLFASVGIVAISWLVSIPSMIPGGLGVRETILSILFSSFGVPFVSALLSVLVYRVMVLSIFGVGTFVTIRR